MGAQVLRVLASRDRHHWLDRVYQSPDFAHDISPLRRAVRKVRAQDPLPPLQVQFYQSREAPY